MKEIIPAANHPPMNKSRISGIGKRLYYATVSSIVFVIIIGLYFISNEMSSYNEILYTYMKNEANFIIEAIQSEGPEITHYPSIVLQKKILPFQVKQAKIITQDQVFDLKGNSNNLSTHEANSTPIPDPQNQSLEAWLTSNPNSHLYFVKKGVIRLYQPFLLNNTQQSVLFLEADAQKFYYHSLYTINLKILLMLITIFAIIFSYRQIQRAIVKPFISLIEMMDRVREENNYSLRLPLPRDDELGILVNGFNAMLSQIQNRERQQLENQHQIHQLAFYDNLTGVPNRILFRELLNNALADAKRQKTMVALLYFDLDNFKSINDTLGHSAGDQLLKDVTQRLQNILRESHDSVMARLGGDEFTIIIRALRKKEDVQNIAKRLIHVCMDPFYLNQREIFITVSIGIALYPQDGGNAEALLQSSDAVMYRAKLSGKNNYKFYTPEMNTAALKKMTLELELRQAVQKEQLQLYYQPKYDFRLKKINGLEGLLRWQNSEKQFIAPDEFIPIAEESGLILTMGTWAVRQACRDCRKWHQAGFPDLVISVNLSPKQFLDTQFLKTIQSILAEEKFPPYCLEFELTESMIMINDVPIQHTLSELKKLGIQLSLDDFGTGYSSLRYLSHFHLDKIKIDRSFIRKMLTNTTDASITSAIIDLAHNLNLYVIAEGVETKPQFSHLRQQGCDGVQGNFISSPVAHEAVLDILKSTLVDAEH